MGPLFYFFFGLYVVRHQFYRIYVPLHEIIVEVTLTCMSLLGSVVFAQGAGILLPGHITGTP